MEFLDINLSIYLKDCIKGMKEKIKDKTVDLVITDPPYGIDLQSGWGKKVKWDKISNDNNLDFLPELMYEINRVTKDDSAIYMYVGVQNLEFFLIEIKKYFKFRNLIVVPRTQKGGNGSLKMQLAPQNEFIIYATKGKKHFEKTEILKPSVRYLKDKRRKNVPDWLYRLPDFWHWCKAGVYNNLRNHITEKDISAFETAILLSSKEGEVILDPFIGSGITAIASLKHKRVFIGFEINKTNFEYSKNRIILFKNENIY